METETIRGDFTRRNADRIEHLNRARLCASLTKPWIQPPEGWSENEKLPEPFSSLASRGITNLEGRLLLALFPPGVPWFKLKPSSRYKFDPNVDPEVIQEFTSMLTLHEYIVLGRLERNDGQGKTRTRRAGFRSRMRAAISQLLICGDVLLQLTDRYTIKVHRLDNYVTFRDTSGDVLYHITQEEIDPLSLSKDMLAKCNLDRDKLNLMAIEKRMCKLYTRVSWQWEGKRWLIQQEINDHIIVTSQEESSPYFSVPFELAPAAHYGIGLCQANIGDIRSMNELTERTLDFAALASKHLFALDHNSQVRPQDLAQPTGSVIQARVQSGQIADVGVLRADKLTDFNVVNAVRESIRRDLSAVMLMEGENQPQGERVTAYQVQRVAMELEGALGGVYAPIADSMQVPLIERLLYQLRRDGELPELPQESVEIEAVTGISALSREDDQGKLLQLMQVLAQLGPDSMSRLDMSVLLDLLMRQSGIYEPGLVKTQEDIDAERDAAMQQQQQMSMQDKMMDAAGPAIQQGIAGQVPAQT